MPPAAHYTEFPIAPRTLEESGLSLDLILQLALKTLHFAGELTGAELSQRLGLNFAVIEPVLELLIQQRQVEIAGGTMVGRASYRYRISDAGRARAVFFLESNHYVGIAPVPFDQYRRYMLGVRKIAVATRRDPGEGPRGVSAPGDQPARARSARARHQRRPLDVRLRPSG